MSEKRPGIEIALEQLRNWSFPVVVDIGAYIGKIGRLCLEANPDCQIHAVEPCPRNFAILKKEWGDTFATIDNVAIGGEEKMVEFYITNKPKQSGSSQSNTFYYKTLKSKKKQKKIDNIKKRMVKCLSFDEYVKPLAGIDLLKINIEGAEYEIFEKTDWKFLEKTNMMFISFHMFKPFNKANLRPITERFVEAGFECKNVAVKNEEQWHLWLKP